MVIKFDEQEKQASTGCIVGEQKRALEISFAKKNRIVMDIVLGAVERAQVDCKNVSIQKNISWL